MVALLVVALVPVLLAFDLEVGAIAFVTTFFVGTAGEALVKTVRGDAEECVCFELCVATDFELCPFELCAAAAGFELCCGCWL